MGQMEILSVRPEIRTLIENVTVGEGFRSFEVTSVETNSKGEGFLSQIYLVNVREPRTGRELNVVVKASIDEFKSVVSILKCGKNEIFFYTNVYPVFREFQEARGTRDGVVEFCPKCYDTYLADTEQLLCLENLYAGNFEVVDKTRVLDHDHISLVFKTYARLHALSYALRDQEPEKFHRLSNGLCNLYEEWIDTNETHFMDFVGESFNLAQKYLIPGTDDEIIKKCRKYRVNGIVESFRNTVTQKDKFSAIIHGDCWSNNLMFKYKMVNNSKRVHDMRLIDLQLAKLGSPVCDLSYCLYSGGSKEIFDNLKGYLNIYYESFSSFLKRLGSDPEKLFPYSVLEDQWKKYSKFGMFMAFMILKIKTTDKDEIRDHTDGLSDDELLQTFLNGRFDEEVFQERVRDLIYHMGVKSLYIVYTGQQKITEDEGKDNSLGNDGWAKDGQISPVKHGGNVIRPSCPTFVEFLVRIEGQIYAIECGEV